MLVGKEQFSVVARSAHCCFSFCQSSVCVHRENTLSHRGNSCIQHIAVVFHLPPFLFDLNWSFIQVCFCLFPQVEQGQGTITVYPIIARSLWVSQPLS